MVRFGIEEYEIPFFKENRYVRKRCKICGEFFWTSNSSRETCGEAPCEPYEFIGQRLLKKSYDINSMREEFLMFFNERGHKIIEPRPVLARWRDDLYLTIASIAVFQPFVTSGEVPPPANPLVISQPCIRLQDLDMVGPTVGRHLSIFEMGGHHAFNYPDKVLYWKDETVRYFYEFAVNRLGIPGDEITFKEGVWEGGGNAGPDFEPIAYGLEIATLVFMKYKVINGRYIEMPLKIVDTGYGIERFTWLSQGTPSAFHSIYGPLLDWLLTRVDLGSLDYELLREHARLSAMVSHPYNLTPTQVKKKVAENLGLNVSEVIETLKRLESVYALLDHTKTIVFMLSDGLVPSNSGEGYLGRLLIRKAFRHIDTLNSDLELREITLRQIDLWGDYYKKIRVKKDMILEVLEIEEGKYRTTLKRGLSHLNKIINEVKKKKEAKLDLDKLIELYDSHGIPPEMIKEISAKEGILVEIPSDFYSIVSSRHVKPIRAEKVGKPPFDLSKFPPTRQLYYENPDLTEFKAKVLGVIGNALILDQTAFYPEGGGQLFDSGIIIYRNREFKVENVQKYDSVILHYVKEILPEEIMREIIGKEIIGRIDVKRRRALMRHHTATHIVLAAARKILGDHVWQFGAQKDIEKARLDITHYKKLNKDDIRKIEELANEIVLSNIEVNARFMERNEAENKFGFELYQGGVVPGRIIRVVSVGDINHQACGGLHVKRTGDIGLIKIIAHERIQDGVERLIFVAGERSLKEFQRIEDVIEETASKLQAQPHTLIDTASKIMEIMRVQKKEVERLRNLYAQEISQKLIKSAKKIGNIMVVHEIFDDFSPEELIMISEKIVKRKPNIISILGSRGKRAHLVIMCGQALVKEGINAGELAKRVSKHIKGGGGGKPYLGQAGGINPEGLKDAISEVLKILKGEH